MRPHDINLKPAASSIGDTKNNFRWNNSRKSFVKIKFAECMIDHLNIPSRTIEVESDIGKSQVSKFGIPDSFAGIMGLG